MLRILTSETDQHKEMRLYRDDLQIGFCTYCEKDPVSILEFIIDAAHRRKGYGTYLLKALLKQSGGYSGATHIVQPKNLDAQAFFEKFGFGGRGVMRRKVNAQLAPLNVVHHLLEQFVTKGDFVIDATAGLGRDTVFLCGLVGDGGRVLAMDILPEAVSATNLLLASKGYEHFGKAVLQNHSQMAELAAPQSAAAVVFNFGYLPTGDHTKFSTHSSSIPALEAALKIVRSGGVVVASLYSGGPNGDTEKCAVLKWAKALPTNQYTVLVCEFANRKSTSPLPVLIIKD